MFFTFLKTQTKITVKVTKNAITATAIITKSNVLSTGYEDPVSLNTVALVPLVPVPFFIY